MPNIDHKNAKNALRKTLKAILKAMDEESRDSLSLRAVENFMTLPEYKRAAIVLAFLSMKEELRTKALIDGALTEGKVVAVPRIGFSRTEGDYLEFIPLTLDYESWPLDRFGIPEPPEAAQGLSLEEMGSSRVVVAVPGLAFDLSGGRMGRGKGYYDRFLAKARAAKANYGGFLAVCGLCFESQIVGRVPMGPWDQRIEFLATETALRKLLASLVPSSGNPLIRYFFLPNTPDNSSNIPAASAAMPPIKYQLVASEYRPVNELLTCSTKDLEAFIP